MPTAQVHGEETLDILAQRSRACSCEIAVSASILRRSPTDQLSTNIEAGVRARANGLMTLEDPLLLRQQISDLAAKVRLPTIYGTKDFVEAGGLISYGVDRRE